MSIDRSLKIASSLKGHRNVLKRAERIDKLTKAETFNAEKDTPIGLPKVANRKITTGKKVKKKGPEEATEGETPAASTT